MLYDHFFSFDPKSNVFRGVNHCNLESDELLFQSSRIIYLTFNQNRLDFPMELKTIQIHLPEGVNIVIGQTHFIKTAEDLYEAVVNSVPSAKFGIAFCEASGPCLVRVEGNDESLKKLSSDYAFKIGAGHTFVITMKDAYPISVLGRIKECPEVCSIICATANPVEIVVAETEQGSGILGVIDGYSPKGIESPEDRKKRYEFLRKIGYKL